MSFVTDVCKNTGYFNSDVIFYTATVTIGKFMLKYSGIQFSIYFKEIVHVHGEVCLNRNVFFLYHLNVFLLFSEAAKLCVRLRVDQ